MEGKKDSRPSAGARASKKFQAKKGPEQGGEETKRQRKRRIGQQQSPPYRPGTRHWVMTLDPCVFRFGVYTCKYVRV